MMHRNFEEDISMAIARAGLRDREKLKTTFRFAAERGWMRCYILYCKGMPVAFMVGYQYANSFFHRRGI